MLSVKRNLDRLMNDAPDWVLRVMEMALWAIEVALWGAVFLGIYFWLLSVTP